MRFETIAVAATIGVTLLAGAGTTSAQQMTAELFPDKDATLIEEPPNNASGSSPAIFIGTVEFRGGNFRRRALISFDIGGSSIPSDATIMDATLTLFLERGGGAASTITLHLLLVDWGEGPSTMGRGQGELAVTGDSTWDDRFYMESAWTASGAEADTDYVASASADQVVPANSVGDVMWADSQLATDVEFWLDNPGSNFGWIMIGSTTSGSAERFSSREAVSPDQLPLLSVTYEVPEPDADGDGVPDASDNCSDVPNPGQDDTDGDNCGNLCDADYDQTGSTGFGDFGAFVNAFGAFDLDLDHTEPVTGPVGFGDFGAFINLFGSAPGPSGTTSGTTACPVSSSP